MATPTRLKNGMTTHSRTHPWNQIGDPFGWMRHYVLFDDFLKAEVDGVLWTSTTDSADSIALVAGQGGIMKLAISGTDDQVAVMQGTFLTEYLVSGKKAWFGTKVKTNSTLPGSMDMRIGLSANDTSPIATSPANHATFRCDDGDALIDFSVVKAGVGTGQTSLATMVAETYMKMDCYFDGVDQFELYIDGVKKGTLTLAAFPTAAMAPMIALQAGAASASIEIYVDYIYSISER